MASAYERTKPDADEFLMRQMYLRCSIQRTVLAQVRFPVQGKRKLFKTIHRVAAAEQTG
jgi:hypothetical protein